MDGISAAFSDQVALQLTTPLDSGKYALEDFQCRETLSAPFEMSLTVTSDNPNISFSKLMGKSITVTIFAKPKKRFFNGVVGHVSQREFTDLSKTVTYQVKLYPKFWLLKFSKDYKIFQKKSAQTIIKEVLQEKGVTQLDDRTQKGGRTVREYCVQYGESHFDFVSRLMEEEGIFYYFEHDNGKHTMVLADQPSAHKDIKESSEIEVEYSQSETPSLNKILSCFIDHQVRIGEHSMTDYNYMTPKTSLFAKAKGSGYGKEAYDYPGLIDIDYKPTKGESEKWSTLRSEQDDHPREIVWGESTCPFFEAGRAFTIQKHLRKDANKRYVLQTVEHHISLMKTVEGRDIAPATPPKVICYNKFYGFPAVTPFRPPLITEKPRVAGSQTAVVTGPSGEEIYTDDQRRIKVQFHWDRLGKKDDATTCWVRVSQGWASNNWGILFTPRVGMEVVVSFINGDPDRPLVTGCVYNADNVPPYLAKDKTRATIKSNTYKGKGFNELRFEDKTDKEEIYLHAQKDWNTHVLENRTTVVEKGSDFKTIKKGDREVVIEGEPGVISTKGEAPSLKHSGKGASQKGDDLLTIQKGSRIVKIMGMGSGKGSYTTTIMKGDRELTIMKGDNTDTLLQGNNTVTYLKGNDTKTIGEGEKSMLLGKGNESKIIGQGNKSLIMGQGNKMNILGSGNDILLLPGGMFLGIMQGLFLKIGGIVIAIGGGGSGSPEAMPGHSPDTSGDAGRGDGHSSKYTFSTNPLGGASGKMSAAQCPDMNIESPCGNMYMKFLDSDIVMEQNGHKRYSVTEDYEEDVQKKYILEVGEKILIRCEGNIDIESSKDVNIKGKNVNITGKSIKLEADTVDMAGYKSFEINAMKINFTATGLLNCHGSLINLNTGEQGKGFTPNPWETVDSDLIKERKTDRDKRRSEEEARKKAGNTFDMKNIDKILKGV